jgi:hypothetical protein
MINNFAPPTAVVVGEVTMETPRIVDLSNWEPDCSYDDCLKLCQELELIEIIC